MKGKLYCGLISETWKPRLGGATGAVSDRTPRWQTQAEPHMVSRFSAESRLSQSTPDTGHPDVGLTPQRPPDAGPEV